MYKIGLISLGCAKNRVDSEIILGLLKDKCEIVNDPKQAQIVIINTCSFIEPARVETRETISEILDLKDQGYVEKVIVTGCYPQRYEAHVQEEFPAVRPFPSHGF